MTYNEVSRTHSIAAAPEDVGAAISSPHGLSTWLCDDAQSEKKTGGRLLFRWHDGRQAIGRWTELDPANLLAWTWRGDDESESTVRFQLRPDDAGTEVTVSQSNVPPEAEDAAGRLWSYALSDLEEFVLSGQNGRMLRRPMLGIMLDIVSAETAAAKGLSVDEGILITDAVADHAAEKAGIVAGDVLVQMDGHELSDWSSLTDALDQRQAGDTVDVRLWRGSDELTLPVTLTSREQPDLPTTVEGVAELARSSTTRMVDAITEALDGVTDEAASFKPSDDEWSIKQVLAHLCVVERFSQDAYSRTAADDSPAGWAMEAFELRQASLENASLDALREWTLGDLRSTEDLALFILDREPTAHVLHDLASNFHWGPEHVDDHVGQIQSILEAFGNADES